MKNEKYLIATDLDGTLLKDDKTISSETLNLFSKLQKAGHVLVFASGRPKESIYPYHKKAELIAPFVASNGANIMSSDYQCLYEYFYKKELIVEFMREFSSGILSAFAESEDKIYFSNADLNFNSMFYTGKKEVIVGSFDEVLDNDCYSFVFQYKDEETKERAEKYQFFDSSVTIRAWYDAPHIAELASTKINKATGVKFIMKLYGIDPSHVIAFGDAGNDIEMLSLARYGFAMKNASSSLKNIIKLETQYTNEEDGVRRELERLLQA